MRGIDYRVGNLFDLLPALPNDHDTQVVIPHIVNDAGAWGAGFVVPLGKRFPKAQEEYLRWSAHRDPNLPFGLGECQIVDVTPPQFNTDSFIHVANMCAQTGLMSSDNPCPIRYEALVKCLRTVANFCWRLCGDVRAVEIHAPAFGSMRAGGDWGIIEKLILEILRPNVQGLYIYTLNEQEQKDILSLVRK